MLKNFTQRWGRLSSGVLVSLILHALILVAIFINLPFTLSAPEQEQSVSVELVPPPEEQQPEEPQQEEPPPEEEQQAEAPEPPPEPPAAEEQAAEEPPPPPPPPPPEEQPEPPPQEEPQQQDPPAPEQQAEQDPSQQAAANPPQQVPIPVLRPVYQFGDADTGERKDLEGDSAEEGDDKATDEAKPEDELTPTTETADAESASGDEQALSDESELPPDDSLPGVSILSAGDAADGIATGDNAPAEPQGSDTADETEQQVASAQEPKLDEVKKLFSRNATNDAVATAAMKNIPRGIRADQLCLTELREQLRNASPPYQPELLPSHKLDKGTVFEVRDSAFRASGQWFNLNFRCEVDQDATKVVSFAYKVGTPIPRSEWVKRRLPH